MADVERAVKAVRTAGLDVGAVEVTREGTIRVKVAGGDEETPETPYDVWRAKKDARAT